MTVPRLLGDRAAGAHVLRADDDVTLELIPESAAAGVM